MQHIDSQWCEDFNKLPPKINEQIYSEKWAIIENVIHKNCQFVKNCDNYGRSYSENNIANHQNENDLGILNVVTCSKYIISHYFRDILIESNLIMYSGQQFRQVNYDSR